MKENIIKIVGLCQVNDIIPLLGDVNNTPVNYQWPDSLRETYDKNNEKVVVPSVAEMEKLIHRKHVFKNKNYISNLKVYILITSLHNQGVGCGGTSPLISPLAVYLAEEGGRKIGGLYCDLTKAYDKFRELVKKYFIEMKYTDPLVLITPDLNKKILKRQLSPNRISLKIKLEEAEGTCIKDNETYNEMLKLDS